MIQPISTFPALFFFRLSPENDRLHGMHGLWTLVGQLGEITGVQPDLIRVRVRLSRVCISAWRFWTALSMVTVLWSIGELVITKERWNKKERGLTCCRTSATMSGTNDL